jgi:hypothetical protein
MIEQLIEQHSRRKIMYDSLHNLIEKETAFAYEVSGAIYLSDSLKYVIHYYGDSDSVLDSTVTAIGNAKKLKCQCIVFHSHPLYGKCGQSDLDSCSTEWNKKNAYGYSSFVIDELIVTRNKVFSIGQKETFKLGGVI